jgi:TonB-linked SusC/RagA family outer membrane protein
MNLPGYDKRVSLTAQTFNIMRCRGRKKSFASKNKTLILAMKLAFILLTTAFLQVSAGSLAQTVTFSGKDVSLKKIFSAIEKQTGYVFFYDGGLLRNAKPVTLNVTNVPIQDVLTEALYGQSLVWQIVDKTITVVKKTAVEEPATVLSQVIDIHGKVTDAEGSPLVGVSVVVKGSLKGTSTDSQGEYNLKGIDNNANLVFSIVGYTQESVSVRGRSTIDVVLKVDVKKQSEVVVIGYGTAERKDLTGSIASVNVDEIKNTPFLSVDQALAGKAPGVQVTQADGSPGGVARIRIRGGASLIGGNDPLYIIDGVPVTVQNRYIQSAADIVNPTERLGSDNSMNTTVGSSFESGLNTLAGLNINDIESIDILKDASATAIYGSKAANGVVIITTKRGIKNEKPILEANYYTGFSHAITEKLLNADQYRSVMLEGAKNVNALRAAQGLPAEALATSVINDPNFLGTANTDWLKLVTRTGITQNADLSVRGGGTGSRYYTSLDYTNQTGTLLGTDFSRLSGKVSLDNEITKRLRVITNLDYGFTKNNITNGIYTQALYAPPTLPPYNLDGSPFVFIPASLGTYAYQGFQNPMSLLQGTNHSNTLLLVGSLSLEYDILKSLKFRSTASVNFTGYHQLNYVPSTAVVASADGVSSSQGGIATQAQTQQTDAFYENTITWDKQFNADNRLNLLVGTSWEQNNEQSFSASGQGFPDDKFLNGLSSAALALPPQASESQNSLLSFYLRANYAFKEKYLLTFTGRSDESSKFPANNRTGYFPSIGIAWRASEEPFLTKVKWLNNLKFRASAGYTGTQNLGDNLFYTLYTPGSYASTNALVPTQLGNDKIKWESTLQKDIGIDFAIFDSRLRGAVGYYDKQSSSLFGLLMSVPVAPSSGFTSALVNLAEIENKGLEVDLRGDLIRNKNLSWNLAVNVSSNRSEVKHILRDIQDPTNVGYSDPYYNSQFALGNTILREGEPVGLIYGYTFKGVIKTQKELEDYTASSSYAQYGILDNLGLGYPMYGLIDTGAYIGSFERDVIGHAEPKFYGGITNTLNYKQFSLIATFTFSYGGELLYMPEVQSFGLGDLSNRNTRILLPHYSDANPDADRPQLNLGDPNTYGTGPSTADVFDASYIKLKSISLTYELPKALISKWHIRTAMVYVAGSNLFTITKYPGPDPEISNDPYSLINGYSDAATYPTMRQYTIGVRLGF